MVKRKKHKREKYYMIITVCYILTMSATSKSGQKRDMLSLISIAVPCPGVADAERHDVVHYILRLSQNVSRLR